MKSQQNKEKPIMKLILCKVPLILLAFCFLKQANAAAVICGNNAIGTVEIVQQKSIGSSAEKVEESTMPATTTTTDIPKRRSEMKQLLRRVQCTLQKAEPWLDEFEQEARRLEETAKRFGEGVIRSFKGIMGKLIGNDNRASNSVSNFFSSIIGIGGNTGNKKQPTSTVNDKQEEESLTTWTPKVTTTEATTVKLTEITETIGKTTTEIIPKTKLTTISSTSTTTPMSSIEHVSISLEDINTMDNEIDFV